ncbi:MAG TPA: ATP synthase F1 subunit epsilon [Chitinophagales bacterium]|nr:ATP synthase F1 subunit epsilon [Chitinophagales bacterium]HRK25997.1 ATP synthase F1 subunit epsilon [Chitinophagales bacterium]HRK27077.1 ATP synthase F1 subunit epsilon [Chitinophagales bacterium]
MHIELITPEQKVFTGDADRIQLPGIDGMFEVLDRHAPLISALKEGKVKITSGNAVKYITISSGFAEILNNNVVVLAETAAEL